MLNCVKNDKQSRNGEVKNGIVETDVAINMGHICNTVIVTTRTIILAKTMHIEH